VKTPKISFKKHEYVTTDLADAEQVVISLAAPGILCGIFAVKKSYLDDIELRRSHKALVLTMTSGLYHETHNLIGGALTFPDDVDFAADNVMGYFTIKLDTLLNMNIDSTAYITVSLGDLLSNTVTVETPKH